MDTKQALLAGICVAMIWLAPVLVLAQAPSVEPSSIIPMNKEPHHHLVFHNDYLNLFDVRVAVGDSIVLHRHDHDALAIAVGDQDLIVVIPNKPDLHQKTPDGQMRLQVSGYIHSTHVNGPVPYHTVAVELLHEQTGKRNLCAAIMASQPLNCPDGPASPYSPNEIIQPQFASDETRIELVRILPHKGVEIGHWNVHQLIVVLDPASISSVSGKGPDQKLLPGDFVWFDMTEPSRTFKNIGDREVRFVELQFPPIGSSGELCCVPGDRSWTEHVAKIGVREMPTHPVSDRF